MPPIWSSSERPITVRTVWVDGIRHAILSHDDPFLNIKSRRRQQTLVTKEKIYPLKYEQYNSNSEGLDNCFLKLRLVVEKSEKNPKDNFIRTQSAPCSKKSSLNNIPRLSRNQTNFSYEDIFQSDINSSVRKTIDTIFDKDINSKNQFNKSKIAFNSPRAEEKNHLNPLSEKVLQWLDISRKVQNDDKEESSDDNLETMDFNRRRNYRRRDNLVSIPIQSYKLEETEKEDEKLRRMKKKHFGMKQTSQDSIDSIDDNFHKEVIPSEEIETNRNVERKIIWCPPGKVQLHIFLPSFKVEKYPSQESLACD